MNDCECEIGMIFHFDFRVTRIQYCEKWERKENHYLFV